MFAEATSMTRVIIDLITRERKTPKYMTKGGGVGMTQASMPEIHFGGEGNRGGGGGGGGGVDRVAHRGCHIGGVPSGYERP